MLMNRWVDEDGRLVVDVGGADGSLVDGVVSVDGPLL